MMLTIHQREPMILPLILPMTGHIRAEAPMSSVRCSRRWE